MVRGLRKGMAVFLGTPAEHPVLPFPVKAVLPANQAFRVRLQHRLRVVGRFLVPALREASHPPVVLPVLRQSEADLRKATRVIRLSPAMDLRQLRAALPLLLRALPWIPHSYPVHLRWNKNRCLAR